MPQVDSIDDEDTLEKMLEATTEFEERKKIRARLRELRKKRRDEAEVKVAAQQKTIQQDIQRSREEGKANRLKAFDKSTPIKKDTTDVALNNNNNIKFISPPTQTSTLIEDGKNKKMTTTSVLEGPGSKTVTTTTLSKTEDKDSKSASMKQESTTVRKSDIGSSTGSSQFSSVSSSSSSVETSSTKSGGGTPAPRKLSKFEADMEEKRKLRELKRSEEEKNWKEYMTKKKQDDSERKKKDFEAAQKKKDALMNKFGGKADGETGGFGKGTGMAAVPNANTIKQKLLEWCKRCARGYPEVEITNFSSSWADGMAFCAIVHYHFPNAFDFESLNKKNRRKNLDLAFESAEKHADIMPLLETDDMILMKNKPDWKCVFTYVQSLYRHLNKLKS